MSSAQTHRHAVPVRQRVLITGAGGFLGRAVLQKLLLNPNYDVISAISGHRTHTFPPKVTSVEMNLLDTIQVKNTIQALRPDICLHFAWDQTPSYRNSPANLRWQAASIELLEAFAAHGGHCFLFAGSSAEYESLEMGQAASSLYGVCKRACSETISAAGAALGIETKIPRYFTIYGSGNPHSFGAIPMAINSFLCRQTFHCRYPNAMRDYIHVEDAAEATISLLNSKVKGAVDVGSGQPYQMANVFAEIAQQMDCTSLLSLDEDALPQYLVADTTTLSEQLHFQCSITLPQGLSGEIAWWRGKKAAD